MWRQCLQRVNITIVIFFVLFWIINAFDNVNLSGGVICFSILVDDHDGQGFGYKEKMDELSTAGMWEFKEKTETLYLPNAAVKQWKSCYIFVYKRL